MNALEAAATETARFLFSGELCVSGMAALYIVIVSAAVICSVLEARKERREKQHQLDDATDYLMRIGFLENERRGRIPEDLQ